MYSLEQPTSVVNCKTWEIINLSDIGALLANSSQELETCHPLVCGDVGFFDKGVAVCDQFLHDELEALVFTAAI